MAKLITTAEVAARLQKSVSQVNRLAKAGTIPVKIQGNGARGDRFYDPDDIDRLLAERAS